LVNGKQFKDSTIDTASKMFHGRVVWCSPAWGLRGWRVGVVVVCVRNDGFFSLLRGFCRQTSLGHNKDYKKDSRQTNKDAQVHW
jgi:hypothetical protein